jgi:glutamyl/glutaminyl-tRNA synthetase
MGVDELVEAFTLERINKKSAVFDTEKLFWMNGRYLERKPADELLPLVAPLLVSEGLVTEAEVEGRRDWLLHLLELLKVRARSVNEIPQMARVYLADEVEYDADSVAKQWKDPHTAERLGRVRQALQGLEPWTVEAIEPALRAAAESLGVGFGKVAQPLRVALTGSSASPGIDHVVYLLGPDRVVRRIDRAVERMAAGTGV